MIVSISLIIKASLHISLIYLNFVYSIVKVRSPSPPRNPPSRILHVENLKRPFTLLQLKDFLQEDGPMIEGGFWTNKIKSHCIAIVSERWSLFYLFFSPLSLSLSLSHSSHPQIQLWLLETGSTA